MRKGSLDRIVEKYQVMINDLAKKWIGKWGSVLRPLYDQDSLAQEMWLALLKAIEKGKFDPDRKEATHFVYVCCRMTALRLIRSEVRRKKKVLSEAQLEVMIESIVRIKLRDNTPGLGQSVIERFPGSYPDPLETLIFVEALDGAGLLPSRDWFGMSTMMATFKQSSPQTQRNCIRRFNAYPKKVDWKERRV